MKIKSNFLAYLFERKEFQELIDSKEFFILTGSHALAFWANQFEKKFRDVSNSDIDIRVKEKFKISTWHWDLGYDYIFPKSYRSSNKLINLMGRILDSNKQPIIDLLCLSNKTPNKFTLVNVNGVNIRVLNLSNSLTFKKIMLMETLEEKHLNDIQCFKPAYKPKFEKLNNLDVKMLWVHKMLHHKIIAEKLCVTQVGNYSDKFTEQFNVDGTCRENSVDCDTVNNWVFKIQQTMYGEKLLKTYK